MNHEIFYDFHEINDNLVRENSGSHKRRQGDGGLIKIMLKKGKDKKLCHVEVSPKPLENENLFSNSQKKKQKI